MGRKVRKKRCSTSLPLQFVRKFPRFDFFCRVFEKSTPPISNVPMVSEDREKCSLEHGLSDIIHHFVKKEKLLKLTFCRRYTTKFVRPFTTTKVAWFPCVNMRGKKHRFQNDFFSKTTCLKLKGLVLIYLFTYWEVFY